MHLTFLAKTTTCLLAAGLLMQANAFGASWTAGTGNWADPDNWEGGVVPDLNNEGAAIANGGTAQITSNVAARTLTIAARNTTGHLEILAGGTLSVGILNMSRLGGSDATLVIRGGALVGPVLNNTDIEVATPNLDYQYSTGLIVVSEGGSLSIPWQITLGRLKGQATLQIGEGGAAGTVVADRIIGQGTGGGSGSVVFNHNESDYAFGTQIGSEYNGDTYSSAVRVVQDGPGVTTLTHTNYYVLGTELNAGVLAVSADANLGAASGTLTFNGGTLRTTAGFLTSRDTVVNAGGGALEVATGTLVHQGVFSGAGTLAKTGLGTLAITGTSSQTGGLSVEEGKLVIGNGANAGSLTAGSVLKAAVTVDGGEFEVLRGTVTGGAGAAGLSSAGNGGTAVTQIAAGNITNSGTIRGGLGGSASVSTGGATAGAGGTGATISASSLLVNNGLIAGGNGGTATTSGFGVTFGGGGGTGVQWTNFGTLRNTGTIAGGNAGSGIVAGLGGVGLQISGGGVFENGAGALIQGGSGLTGIALGVQFTSAAGTLVNMGTILGGVSMGDFANEVTLHTGGVIVQGGLQMGNSTAAHLTLDGSGAQNFTTAVGTSLTFNGTLTKVGSGTWTMDRGNTYGGGTDIQAGTLVITVTSPNPSALGTGEVNVGVAGTLAGVGSVLGDTTIAGTLAPGNSPGTINFAGDLLLQGTAMIEMELALGSTDLITVGGLLTYDGTLNITLLGGYTPEVGDTFNLFDAGTVAASAFDAITFEGTDYTGSMNYTTGVLTITAVPEPATALLLTLGGCATFFCSRKRRQA